MPDPVLTEKRFYQTARFWRWTFFVLYFAAAIYLFRKELRNLMASALSLLRNQEELAVVFSSPEVEVLGISSLAFLVFFFILMMVESQFVLPVQTLEQRGKAFNRIWRYFFRKHGPAVFVREAEIIGQDEEIECSYPGVVFVDLCSAIALENQLVMAPCERTPEPGSTAQRRISRGRLSPLFRRRRVPRRGSSVRVAGPGLVFTERGERLRGVADMRRQFRLIPNVSFATRDGFSVLSHVFTIFSLGEPAEVLNVVCQGDTAADIRSVQVDQWTRRVTGFRDELDSADKAEIFQYLNTYRPETAEEILPDDRRTRATRPPYEFNPDRIFAAIYSDSQNSADNDVEPWTVLPPRVAIDVFRDMLSMERFDDLYRPDTPYQEGEAHTFPFLERFRPEFTQRMRNLGVLSYQAARRRDGRLLQIGDAWDDQQLESFPERSLRNSKVLRDRGIRVVVAGFPELNPAHPGVRQQLMAYWAARWQQEADLTEAEHALEAMRVQTKARADAQRDLVEVLRRVYNLPELSQEALVYRLFQTFENVAGEPRTRQLLPADSLGFLWELRDFLLPSPGSTP